MFKSKHTPITDSQMASTMIETVEGINPTVNESIVFFARSSAGLRLGKNFNAPNQMYTSPILIARM